MVCCGECQDGARHLAIALLLPKHPGITVAQAVARMRCRIGGQRCGAAPSHVRIEEGGGLRPYSTGLASKTLDGLRPERGSGLQVVLRGGPFG